jgi:hypothetical protein
VSNDSSRTSTPSTHAVALGVVQTRDEIGEGRLPGAGLLTIAVAVPGGTNETSFERPVAAGP